MKKVFWILGIGLAVLIVVVGIGVGMYMGPIVKIGMEDMGPKITGVSIKVDSVDVSLLSGSAQFKGLVVGNPEGYKAPQAINVSTIAVSMAPTSVLSDKIMVHSVRVESPEITFEGGLGGNNLSKILSNVNGAPKNGSTNQTNGKPAPKIEVDDFLITGAKVHVGLTGLGSKDLTLPLPDIHLTDLGKGSDGLTPAELTGAILKAITSDTIKAVAGSVTGLGQGAGATVSDGISKITSSIGGLFGK